MNEQNDIQKQTDLEQAKARLEAAQQRKDAQADPRSGETTVLSRRNSDQRIPDDEREIKEGKVPPKKKGLWQKVKEALMPEDIGNGRLSDYLVLKIIVPSFKRLTYEALNTALCSLLNIDPKNNRIIGGGNTHTANASLYRRRSYGGGMSRSNPLADCEWDEETAKDYFNDILEAAEKYGDVSVTQVLSICGLGAMIRTTDRNWGWTKAMLSRADVYPVDTAKERWIIDLPEPRGR